MTPLQIAERRRARVLHIGKFYPPYKGGMETHLQDLCRSLSPYVNVSVLVSNDGRHTVHGWDGEIPVQRVASWAHIASAPICPGMVRAIRRASADIVHLHCPNPIGVASYLASGHSGHVVVTYHSDIVRQRILRFAYEPLFHQIARRAKAIICLSPNYRESSPVLSHYREKCHVIPHGIDLSCFQNIDTPAAESIRERYGNQIILAVGRLVYYKGFEYLIRAIEDINASLLIIGTGPLRENLETVARECGVVNRVHFLGEFDDVAPYYRAAQVFVLPSIARSEAFGIVQLEAMACGTPVINTMLDSGVPFVSLHGVSGITVPPCDSSALRSAILNILESPRLRDRFSSGAIDRVKQTFTLESMTEKTLQLYEQILLEGIAERTVGELEPVTA